jgi:hypothetical protein
MRMPEPVQDGRDTRPYFVWSILLVEPSSGVVVGMDLAPFEVRETRLQQAVLSALERLKRLPEEVRVQDERIEQVLAPVTGPLGVRQSRQRRLPALRAVQRELAAFAGGPGW